jgi:hypothetical protein
LYFCTSKAGKLSTSISPPPLPQDGQRCFRRHFAAPRTCRQDKYTPLTCFTGTKVQILTQLRCFRRHFAAPRTCQQDRYTPLTCFAGTKVQILTERVVPILQAHTPANSLLYSYKSTCFTGTNVLSRI